MSPKKKDGTNVDDERATSFCSLEKAEDRSTFHQLGKKILLTLSSHGVSQTSKLETNSCKSNKKKQCEREDLERETMRW